MANINWYPGHMAKTKRLILEKLSFIDIIFEVVDARMPYSSKIKDLDKFTRNKPRLMIMTKYDLCDKKVTNEWISKYEKEGYTVLPMDISKGINKKVILDKTSSIMSEVNLKREKKGLKEKKTRILIVGIPNVGKSTLINRLVNKNVTKTGNKPGVTKGLEWIRINNDFELLDSPGILWPKISSEKEALNLASLTAIKEEVLPISDVAYYIVETLVKYYPKELENRYKIEVNEDVILTMEEIGKRRGCLVKGGIVDLDKVYNIVINDVKNGNISNITFDRCVDFE